MKQRFRYSIGDLFVVVVFAAAFLIVNLVQRDIGSGVHIMLQGWPFPAATNHSLTHSLNGITIHWFGVLANILTGVALVEVVTIIIGKLGRVLALKTEIQNNREIVG